MIIDQDHLQYHPVIVITSVRVSNRQLEKAGLDIEDWMYVVNKGGVEVITMMIMMIMILSSKLPLLIAQLMIFVLSFGFLYFQIQGTEKYSTAMCYLVPYNTILPCTVSDIYFHHALCLFCAALIMTLHLHPQSRCGQRMKNHDTWHQIFSLLCFPHTA